MTNKIDRRRGSAPAAQRPEFSFRDFIADAKVTPEHITQVLAAVSQVVEARTKAGLLDIEATQHIRVLLANLRADSERVDRALEAFDKLQEHLSPEERSAAAAAIIRTQLRLPGGR